jgi:hypothetical protein
VDAHHRRISRPPLLAKAERTTRHTALQLPLDDCLIFCVDAVNMEHRLGDSADTIEFAYKIRGLSRACPFRLEEDGFSSVYLEFLEIGARSRDA